MMYKPCIILKIIDSLYDNPDAIPSLLHYIARDDTVYTGGYGFYPMTADVATECFQEVQDIQMQLPDRRLWHLILSFSPIYSLHSILTIAYEIAELFSNDEYLILYGLHEKKEKLGKRYHIHFAIQAFSYSQDQKVITPIQMENKISQIEQILVSYYNIPLYIHWEGKEAC